VLTALKELPSQPRLTAQSYPMDLSMGGITPNPERDILEKIQL
jgi:hypothetical protein